MHYPVLVLTTFGASVIVEDLLCLSTLHPLHQLRCLHLACNSHAVTGGYGEGYHKARCRLYRNKSVGGALGQVSVDLLCPHGICYSPIKEDFNLPSVQPSDVIIRGEGLDEEEKRKESSPAGRYWTL